MPRADKSRSGQTRSTGRVIEYQKYIDGELQKTRRRVKWVDIAASLTLLAAAVLGYLLLAAVIDHWVVPGGLGFWGRLLLCVGLVGGVAYYVAVHFIPFLLRKVNPVYAAEAIERGQPMKNTLINFLLLRKQSDAPNEQMLDAMKEQAAVRLSAVPADAPVDRTVLIRLGYVFCAVLITALGYALFGPKDALRSVNRVIAPWADLAPSTRVRIMELEPGEVEKRRDEVVEIKVRTKNMRAADEAAVFYSTSGKPEDDLSVPLRSDDAMHWSAVIPGGSEGLKQDLYYYVKVGDVESPRYRIRVAATPVITVSHVRYEYPEYIGLPPREVKNQGDLRGIEGTRVILTAETNQRIKSAYIAFDSARNRDVELAPDESLQKAVGSFELALSSDRTKSKHGSYMLRFANIDGQENPKPIEYKIEVTADQAPEIKVVEPTTPNTQEIKLPLGSPLRITLSARDPDFKVADLAVVFERGGAPLAEERLLPEPRDTITSTHTFDSNRYGLKVGDRIAFRGRAKDNKTPQPNVVETPRYMVAIVPRDPSKQQQPPQADDRNQQDQRNNPQDGGANDPNQQGRPQQGRQQQGNDPNNGKPEDKQRRPENGADDRGGRANNEPRTGQGKPQDEPRNGNPENGGPQNGQPEKGRENEGRPQGNQQTGEQRAGQPNQDPNAGPRDPNSMPPGTGNQQGKPGDTQGDNRNETGEKNGPEQPRNGDSPNNGQGDQGAEKKPADPNANPGDVFDRLQKHFDKQDGKEEGNQDGDAGRKPNQENGSKPNGDQNGSREPNQQPKQSPKDNSQPDGKPAPGEEKPEGANNKQGPNRDSGMNEAKKPEMEKGNEKGAQNGAEQGSQKGRDEANDPNGKGGKPEDENGNQPPKNDGASQNGDPSGAGKQSGGNEGKPGGDQQPGGNASGKPTDQSGNKAGSPGGNEAMREDPNAKGATERREGKNEGGRVAERKPTDGDAGRKTEAGEKTEPGDASKAKPAEKQEGRATGEKPGEDAPMPGSGTKPSDGGNQQPPKTGTTQEGNPTPNRAGKQSNSGDGGDSGSASSKPDDKPTEDKNAKSKPGDIPEGKAGEKQGEKPSANAGQQASNQKKPGDAGGGDAKKEGTPESQENAKPRDNNSPGEAGGKEESKEEGKSPSNSKHESSASGESGGDKSGDGQKGAGMQSKKEGTGASGSNTPGEKGSGAAAEDGDSVAGNKPGDKTKGKGPEGNQPNGSPSGEQGNGKQSRPGGEQSGGGSQSSNGAAGGDQPNGKQRPSSGAPGDQPRDGGARGQGGGGLPDGSGAPNSESAAPPPVSEEANLEDAKKKMDLVLNRLGKQLEKGELDPELQKLFGDPNKAKAWYEKQKALHGDLDKQGPQGDAARETLKLYGFQGHSMSQRGRRTGDDDSRNLVGSRRSEPPAKYADQFHAYTRKGQGRALTPPQPPAKQP